MLDNGYNINYLLNSVKGKGLKPAVLVHNKESGRGMELLTNAPGLQFDTNDELNIVKEKGGYVYKPHAGLLLATQGFPDSVNQPNFPSQIVRKGKPYKHFMTFKFSTKAATAEGRKQTFIGGRS